MRQISLTIVILVAYSAFCANCESGPYTGKTYTLDGSVTDAIICQSDYNKEVHVDNCIFNAESSSTTYLTSYIHITESRQVTIQNSKFKAVKLSGRAALVLGRFVNVSIIENTNFTDIINTDGNGSALNLEIHPEFGKHTLDHVIFQS
ncbi:MAG: hypothetical protein EZS28_050396, partial [Streblomastix strix]